MNQVAETEVSTSRIPGHGRLGWIVVVILFGTCLSARAQDTIRVWSGEPPDDNMLSGPETREECVGNITEATLTVYRPAPEATSEVALLVVPGGGYQLVCMDHEGAAVAEWLNQMGITVGVLKYRLPNGRASVPIQDAQQALRIMRSRAESWGVAPDKIGIMGFSAGGHLASTVGTHFGEDYSGGKGDALDTSHRPDFMILVYPVISMTEDVTHGGSRRNLLGEHPADSTIRRFSSHLQVTAETPPTILIHATDDQTVPPRNSLTFYEELKSEGVPAELHIFERGGHGFATAEDSPARGWMPLVESWLSRVAGLDEVSR